MKKLYLILCFLSYYTFGQGWLSDSSLSMDVPQKVFLPGINDRNLPASADLSKYVPSVIDQQDYETCVPVATTYYLRTMLEAIKLKVTNENGYEELDALRYSPSYIYARIRRDIEKKDCKTYTYIEDAMKALKTDGSVKYDQLPYPDCNPDLTKYNPDPSSQILDYVRLFSFIDDGNKVLATKRSLADSLPLVVGLQVNVRLKKLGNFEWIWHKIKSFFGLEDEGFALWKPSDNDLTGGHGVCVVGYDDKKFDGQGAFKIVNSYGERWGDDGFFWVLYSDYERLAKQAYQAILPRIPKDQIKFSGEVIYLTDSYGQVDDLTSSENEANVVKNYNLDSTNVLTSYTVKGPIKEGSHFRFEAKTNQDFFIYILDRTIDDNHLNIIFPYESNDYSNNNIRGRTKYTFPQQGKWQLKAPAGEEKVVFLFSQKRLDIVNIQESMNALNSVPFDTRLKRVFGSELINSEFIDYDGRDPKKMRFYVNKNHQAGTIVPLIFTYNHVL